MGKERKENIKSQKRANREGTASKHASKTDKPIPIVPPGTNPSDFHAHGSQDQGWMKPPNLSSKFDLLIRKDVGDLTIAQLNVEKIGRVKRKELAVILTDLRIDCLAIVEHHIKSGDYQENVYATLKDNKALCIKGFNVASKHRDQASGGVAWYWKKGLNIEPWDETVLPDHLKEASRERCWIKINSTDTPVALGVVYMPTETPMDTNGAKYQSILDVLSLDSKTLDEEGITNFIYGDLNAHVGTPAEDPLGITGNKPQLGHNGIRLITWLNSHGKVLVNSQPFAKGLWTFQSSNGRTLSVLDYMICNKGLVPQVKGFVIDDDREVTKLNNDHNMLISLLDINYKKIEWKKENPTKKWDTKNIDKKSFRATLENEAKETEAKRIREGSENSAVKIISDVSQCLISALKNSTSLITPSKSKPKFTPDIVELK